MLVLAAATVALAGCSRQPAPPSQAGATAPADTRVIPVADRPPATLVGIGDAAKGLFDAAVAADWRAASEWTMAISESASALPSGLPKADLVGQLGSLVAALKGHVTAHERIETMDYSNTVTRLVADLSAEFQTDVPYDAVMLGFYGRQLELGIATVRPSTLTQAVTDLRSTWNRLQPVLLQRGQTDEARRFTDVVVQLEGAKRPADFVAPTRAELTEADRIEKLFRSRTS
ncbi:MAG: hypothetical protein C5B57_07155 [Blastocatellia bacterium]|nr:MAG: hypothetical protein C5B57_07155 [Blastocatellia bacterium]